MNYEERIIDGVKLRLTMTSRHVIQVVCPRKWRMKFRYMPSGEIEAEGQAGNLVLERKILKAVKELGNSCAWEYRRNTNDKIPGHG